MPELHPLLGQRMPDLDLVRHGESFRVYGLLHEGRPILLDLIETSSSFDIGPWSGRVRHIKDINATYPGAWELPAIGRVESPAAVLIRPDGYVAWVGNGTDAGLHEALTLWFGSPGSR